MQTISVRTDCSYVYFCQYRLDISARFATGCINLNCNLLNKFHFIFCFMKIGYHLELFNFHKSETFGNGAVGNMSQSRNHGNDCCWFDILWGNVSLQSNFTPMLTSFSGDITSWLCGFDVKDL